MRAVIIALRICFAPSIRRSVGVEGEEEKGSMKAGLRGFQNSGSGFRGSRKKRFIFMMMMKRSLVVFVGSSSVA